MFPTQVRFESQPASPHLPPARGERLNSSTRELVLSSLSVIEAGISNSDLSMEELGKDIERREGCLGGTWPTALTFRGRCSISSAKLEFKIYDIQ